MRKTIVNLQNSDAWKIQLTIAINFIYSKDADEECLMHSGSDNIKLTPYSNANEVIDELFGSLHSKYHVNLEISLRRSDFIFDSIQLMHYKCHRVNFIRGGSYINSPDWIKKKKATANPVQYAATVTLNYEEIKPHPKRTSNIKPFIIKHNWKGKNYPSKIDIGKRFRKIIHQFLLIFCISQKLIRIVKNKYFY